MANPPGVFHSDQTAQYFVNHGRTVAEVSGHTGGFTSGLLMVQGLIATVMLSAGLTVVPIMVEGTSQTLTFFRGGWRNQHGSISP